MNQSRRTVSALVLLGLALVAFLPATAQTKGPTYYTYVAGWTVQRAQWSQFEAGVENLAKPVLDKLVADGTLVEWGFDTNEIHTPEGSTHSVWWTATSQGSVMRALRELQSKPENPAAGAVTRHRDLFLYSITYNVRMGGKKAAYDVVSSYQVKPGRTHDWDVFFDKYEKPVFEKLLADGVILGYGVDAEDFHTDSPGGRYVWVLFANADDMDKVDAAFEAARAKYPAEANKEIGEAFNELVEPGAHRDALARIISFAHK